MAKYEKWLGAGIGLLLTGPVGGLLGYMAGTLVEKKGPNDKTAAPTGVSEFEVNLMVLAANLIKIDGKVTMEELVFTQNFMNDRFDAKFDLQRKQILNQCLQKDYDLNAACGQIRMYATINTKIQVVHFMFDLAMCDGALNEAEIFFIFKIAGFLNVNDVEFRKIKNEHARQQVPDTGIYELLGAESTMNMAEIRTIYRRLVLKYHPDKNTDATEDERRNLARKFQQIQEAYQKIKLEKGE